VLGCLLVGVAIAAVSQPASLLEGARTGPPVQENAWQQIYHAKTVDTEEAWQAVLDRSDATEFVRNLARQGLAYRRLTWGESYQSFREALVPLEQLAASPQKPFQVFGIAGQVVAYTGLNEDELAYQAYTRLSAEDHTLLQEQAPRMFELLNAAIEELARGDS
jgi:hypothetical protein